MSLMEMVSGGDGLKHVTERPVADIMEQGGEKCRTFSIRIPLGPTRDDVGELSRRAVHADAMGEAAVGRAGEDQIREPKLTNPP